MGSVVYNLPTMRVIQRIAWIAAIPFVATAQTRANAVSYFESSISGVISQFVDGGAWKTIVTLVNLDTSVGTYTLHFYADDGSPMSIQTTKLQPGPERVSLESFQ
jgi:hypothetical protein